jgi:hypothetical protein
MITSRSFWNGCLLALAATACAVVSTFAEEAKCPDCPGNCGKSAACADRANCREPNGCRFRGDSQFASDNTRIDCVDSTRAEQNSAAPHCNRDDSEGCASKRRAVERCAVDGCTAGRSTECPADSGHQRCSEGVRQNETCDSSLAEKPGCPTVSESGCPLLKRKSAAYDTPSRATRELLPGEPTQQILELLGELSGEQYYGLHCPGLIAATGDEHDACLQRRAQMIEVLREIDAQERLAERALPEPIEEVVGQRVVNRRQYSALRESSSELEEVAARLEAAELCEEADLVRRLADDLRHEARQAAAQRRNRVYISSVPSRD